jgi:hypothetical protein
MSIVFLCCYIEINRTVFIFLHVFLHTNLPSCPLYFLHCYIERNRLVGQEDEILYATTEEAEVQSSKRYTNSDSKSNTQIGTWFTFGPPKILLK